MLLNSIDLMPFVLIVLNRRSKIFIQSKTIIANFFDLIRKSDIQFLFLDLNINMDLFVDATSSSTQNSESNLLDDMRREAEANALRIIQAKLEKPENLESLDQLRTAADQRKVLI